MTVVERFDVWQRDSHDNDTVNDCYNKQYKSGSDNVNTGPRSYCNLTRFLKSDPHSTCLPTNCDLRTLQAPSRHYDLTGIRFDSLVNGHSGCGYSGRPIPSIFIGPGTRTTRLVEEGWLPVSLTDRCALLHDYGYVFSCGRNDSIAADRALSNNLAIIERDFGETTVNTSTARRLTNAGSAIGATVGPHSLTNEGWGNTGFQYQAAEIINILADTLGLDIGYFERYRCGPINPDTGKRKVVLINPICGSTPCEGNPGENGIVEPTPLCPW